MTTLSPYAPLEVIQTYSRVDGYRAWVRDEEMAHLFVLVEYVERRLVCWCDDGQAHAESPNTEDPCDHLRAVVDLRVSEQKSSSPRVPVNAAAFID